ncbi:hypothetical protein KM043_015055 [Ampulex compressa]|nr:hypothetical protein KM043_015055 [Ampulex compressa]
MQPLLAEVMWLLPAVMVRAPLAYLPVHGPSIQIVYEATVSERKSEDLGGFERLCTIKIGVSIISTRAQLSELCWQSTVYGILLFEAIDSGGGINGAPVAPRKRAATAVEQRPLDISKRSRGIAEFRLKVSRDKANNQLCRRSVIADS